MRDLILQLSKSSIYSTKPIIELKNKGFTELEIANKIGRSKNWVSSIVSLKENGEDKLLSAVESGRIPIYIAVEISRAKGVDI
ncbi:TPA: hypothetical protein MIO10_26690, partial [Klebsiella pneumoniae]|nr:hypothetical protein [Klebsiella pneumoniae]